MNQLKIEVILPRPCSCDEIIKALSEACKLHENELLRLNSEDYLWRIEYYDDFPSYVLNNDKELTIIHKIKRAIGFQFRTRKIFFSNKVLVNDSMLGCYGYFNLRLPTTNGLLKSMNFMFGSKLTNNECMTFRRIIEIMNIILLKQM